MKNNEVVLYEATSKASTNIWGNISSTAVVALPTLISLNAGSLTSTLITLGISGALSLLALSFKRVALTSNLYNPALLTLMPESRSKNNILLYPSLYESEREAYLQSAGNEYRRKSNFRSFLRKLFLGKETYVHNEFTIDSYGSINRKIVEIDSRKIVIVDRKTESDLAIWLNAVKNAYMLDPNFNLREAKRVDREENYMIQQEKAASAKRQAERTARIAMDKEKIKFQKLTKSNQENLKTMIKMHKNNVESESIKTINIRSGVLDQGTIENTKNNAAQLEQMIFERKVQHQKAIEKITEQKRYEQEEKARQQKNRIKADAEISKMERLDRYRQLYIEATNRQNAALDYENAFSERLAKQAKHEALSDLKPSPSMSKDMLIYAKPTTPVVSKEQPHLKDIERIQLKQEMLRNEMAIYKRSRESRLYHCDEIEKAEKQMMKYRVLVEQLAKQSEQEALSEQESSSELKPSQSTPVVSKDLNSTITIGG